MYRMPFKKKSSDAFDAQILPRYHMIPGMREAAAKAILRAYHRAPVLERTESSRGRVDSPVSFVAFDTPRVAGVNVSRVEAYVNRSGTLAREE